MNVYVLLTVLFLINTLDCVQSDAVSLSIAGMESLVKRETILIDNLELYLGELEKKAKVIRSNLERMRAENNKALQNVEEYLMNPLQAFSLLRRMHSDWTNWELYMAKPIEKEYVLTIKKERPNMPTKEELHEATDAMLRLQHTYALNAIEMSMGKLNKVQYGVKLSAIDCFSIAYYLHEKENYEDAALWFHAAMSLFQDNDPMNEVLDFKLQTILYFYAQTFGKQGILDRSILLLNRLLTIDPYDSNAIQQKKYWEMELKATETMPQPSKTMIKPFTEGELRYQAGCRGEFKQRMPNLYCVYNTTTDPFLKLAPFKMELINLDPYMVLFHDVITDFEIESLKNLARPHLMRATVYNAQQKASVPVSTRTSKSAWFSDNTNEVTEKVNRRISLMTGFNLATSEQLQMMNYGLGGHYDTHYDFFNASMTDPVVERAGDRIATALFYLSDVEQGGATVFPNIELTVYPKKGACIMWYNLNIKGEGDANTLHAACPVLVGSKWVCNKWIREKDQIFRRPCLRE